MGHARRPNGRYRLLTEGPDGALSTSTWTFRHHEYGGDQQDPSHPVHQRRQPATDRRGGATPSSGPLPLTVCFSSAGSSDPDEQPLSSSWTFDDGRLADPDRHVPSGRAVRVGVRVSGSRVSTLASSGVVLTARFELVSQSSGRWLYIVVREELILPHASLSLQPSTRTPPPGSRSPGDGPSFPRRRSPRRLTGLTGKGTLSPGQRGRRRPCQSAGTLSPSGPQTSAGIQGVRLTAERLKKMEHAPVLASVPLRHAEDR